MAKITLLPPEEQLDFIRRVMRHWFRPDAIAGWQKIPDDYMVIDTETTGFRDSDLVLEIGWVIVRNRQIVHNSAFYLNWLEDPRVDNSWLAICMDEVRKNMASKGRTYHPTLAKVAAGGGPTECLTMLYDLIVEEINRNNLLIGHNLWSFDQRMLNNMFMRFCNGKKLPVHQFSIFDTGLMEKAAQINRLPFPEETPDAWWRRCASYPFNVKWALDDWCIPKYKLNEHASVDMSQLHSAAADCMATHLLFEAYRKIAE